MLFPNNEGSGSRGQEMPSLSEQRRYILEELMKNPNSSVLKTMLLEIDTEIVFSQTPELRTLSSD